MWYRVEFNKDGSIKESRVAEARGTDSGLVCYIDADTSVIAIREAVAWRRRYLERARVSHQKKREESKRTGLCRSCFRRKCPKGMRTCTECRNHQNEKRSLPHSIRHNAPADEKTTARVAAQIGAIYGRNHVSQSAVSALLRGESAPQDAAIRVARALRSLGHEATASHEGARAHGGGRYSLAETELALLLVVYQNHKRLTGPKFDKWLDDEIAERRARISASTEAA